MTTTCQPHQCLICGGYLTMSEEYVDNRCTDPGHWLAAGLLARNDFYQMAQLIASARPSLARPASYSAVAGTSTLDVSGGSGWSVNLRQFLTKFYK